MNFEFSYDEYLQHVNFIDEEGNERLANELFDKLGWHSPNPANIGVIFFAIDYPRQVYLHLGNNIGMSTGYGKEIFLKEGIKKMMSIVEPDDFEIFNHKIFPVILKFLQENINGQASERFTFSFNFRVKGINDELTCFWQQCIYIVSPITKLPIYCIGSITDISGLKRGNSIILTIDEWGENMEQKKLHNKIIFNPNEEDLLLTKKEKEIVIHLAKGFSTKQISKNTIKNHRQNMMQKTNSKNMVELVAFAIRNRII